MDFNFTQFISYSKIDVDEIDLYEDAYGLNTEFIDVREFLGQLSVEPGRYLTDKLIWKVKKLN
ncbi:MAG: hypothetical protein ACM3UT_05655 [Chloroflexota bacterium]